MKLTIEVPDDVAKRIAASAKQEGRPSAEVAGSLLQKLFPPTGMKRWVFTGILTCSREATKTEISAYISDAVGSWCGSLRPPLAYGSDDNGDPMWGVESVNVLSLGEVK